MIALRRAALQLGFDAGLFGLTRFAARRRQAVILMFHRFFADGEGHPRGMPIGKFEEFMAYLTRRYRVVSLHELTNELRRGVVQPCTAVVTIDDGYHEIFTLVAPVLRRYGVPASVFVVSEFVNGRLWLWPDRFDFVFDHAPRERLELEHSGSRQLLDLRGQEDRVRAREHWRGCAKSMAVAERDRLLETIARAAGVSIPIAPPREYRPMTWSQLRTLAAQGFDVGAHTRTHPILSHLESEQLRVEIEECKEHIEQRLGAPVRHFAYPNGCIEDYTQETVAAVARAGYFAAVTAVHGSNSASTPLLELRRISSGPENLARFAERVSGFNEMKMRARLRSGRTAVRVSGVGEATLGPGAE